MSRSRVASGLRRRGEWKDHSQNKASPLRIDVAYTNFHTVFPSSPTSTFHSIPPALLSSLYTHIIYTHNPEKRESGMREAGECRFCGRALARATGAATCWIPLTFVSLDSYCTYLPILLSHPVELFFFPSSTVGCCCWSFRVYEARLR